MGIQLFGTRNDSGWVPSDHGFLTWTSDPALTAGTTVPSAQGTLHCHKLWVPNGGLVTNIVAWVTTGGGTLTSDRCFMALYNSSGTLLSQTADQAVAWASTGLKTMPLAVAQTVGAGFVTVAFWYSGTTSPTWPRQTGSTAGYSNANLASPNLRFFTADTGITNTAPASLGAQTALTQGFWLALS